MADHAEINIPVLTDVLGDRVDIAADGTPEGHPGSSAEALVAELQTELAAKTFALTQDLLRSSFIVMQAALFEEVSAKLRRELPELIDVVLREHLTHDET